MSSANPPVQDTFRIAHQHHAAGRLDEAGVLYAQVLRAAPDHFDALHLSGVLAHQRGNHGAALELIRKALAVQRTAIAYANLGAVLVALGRRDEAIAAFRAALDIEPRNAGALKQLATVLKDLRRLDEAIRVFAQLLPLLPDAFDVNALYGQALQDSGDLEGAIVRYRRALELQPGFGPLWSTLGALLLAQGKAAEAEPVLQRARQLQPGDPTVPGNLGIALRKLGRDAEAEPLFRESLRRQPDSLAMHGNLAAALQAQGKHAEAEPTLRRIVQQQPDAAIPLNNLAAALNAQGKYAEAEGILRHAAALQPDAVAVQSNLGLALLNQGKHADAELALRRTVQLAPDDPVAHSNLAIALLNQGKHAEADAIVRHFLQAFPDAVQALSPMLYALTCDAACSPREYLAAARRYGAAVTALARPYTTWRTDLPGSDVATLRVGLVSGDMRTHPVGFFLENLVTHLDPRRASLTAYTTRAREDELTARLKPHLAAWRDISALDDEAAARLIHDDGIHVLVDLAGHTTHNRLPLFAWKPAPLQVSWLGYFASTGVPAIDYVLVDPVSVGPGEQANFSERTWYLPETRLCFTPPSARDAPEPAPPPALANGYITFGSFQNMVKLGDGVLATWARVLARVEHSCLRLQNAEMAAPAARDAFRQRMAELGVAPERIALFGPVPRTAYFAAYAGTDILLDTFPYPGGTTTCEALWMGVPTLTLAGDTLLARQGASMLAAVGLQDWIAHDEDDYVARAAAFAADPGALARLRAGLRARMRASPLCDGDRFARHFADALHGMWRARHDSTPPAQNAREPS